MKKVRNKQWRDKHAKIKHRHELKRRYRYEEKYYKTFRKSYELYGSEKYYQSEKAKKRLQRKLSRNSFQTLEAPENFSIFSNPEDSLSFFSNIETKVEFGDPIYFDMKNIEKLSIDTIMYFLALLKKIKYSGVAYGIKGSVPSNKNCRDLLESSGFYKYVHSGRMMKDLSYESDVVQISNGQNADPSTAQKICDFTMSKLNRKRKNIRSLYDMIIELMSNTKQHAYSSRYSIRDWYIFVSFISEKKSVRLIFLDTGEGIPTTVKRTGFEVIKSIVSSVPFVSISTKHTEYIQSALKGKLRSRTGDLHRGKGLPKIYSFHNEGHINNLTIISNRGYFAEDRNDDMKEELKGTIFYWELS
jgi:hypothetical protein